METFNVGDLVKTENGEIGIVGWNENKCMDLAKEDGYIGISLLTHGRGFMSPVKAEKCVKSSINKVVEFYESEEVRLMGIIHQQRVDKNRLEQLRLENKYLKQLLGLYIKAKINS